MTGIRGLDEIVHGGLPRSRTTLVCGGPGAGKTLLAMEFLVHGAKDYDEPALFVSFDEQPKDLVKNYHSVGFDIPTLVKRRLLHIEFISMGDEEVVESGNYDLEGLFIRLGAAIKATGAKRVVLDSLDSLFARFTNMTVLRYELQRLFKWLKDQTLTTVVTCESGDGKLTKNGIEEYVSDCVIVLAQNMNEQISTRNLRIIKYRGSAHGTNEYPFLIDKNGILIVPITSLELRHPASKARISTGITGLDRMLGGKGFYRGSIALVSGVAGSGKTSIASHFIDAACSRGERTLYCAFEESPQQIIRNMQSIGLNLERWRRKRVLEFYGTRPCFQGLEAHLAEIYQAIDEFRPANIVLDPITDFAPVGAQYEIKATLTKLVSYIKSKEITCLFTSLVPGGFPQERTGSEISSLVDTWLLVRNTESTAERNRLLFVLKSRGMAHSNQVREFQLTNDGIRLVDVCIGPQGILTGSARIAYEEAERSAKQNQKEDAECERQIIEARRRALEANIALLKADFESEMMETRVKTKAMQRNRKNAADAQKSEADMRGGTATRSRRQARKGKSS